VVGGLLLALRAGAGAPGMRDAVVRATPWTLREALAVRAALALWDGGDPRAVRLLAPGGGKAPGLMTGGARRAFRCRVLKSEPFFW
jgi:hypothetical protein